VLLARGSAILGEHLPEDIVAAASASADGERAFLPLAAVVKRAEREHILRALAIAHGKRTRAAELLGISRKNLWEKLAAHGLSDSDVEEN